MRRFFKNLFKHPGTWVLASLIFTFAGIFAVPMAAAALAIFAAVAMLGAAIALVLYIGNLSVNSHENYGFDQAKGPLTAKKLTGLLFVNAHPVQALMIGLAVAGLITALVLTIGFFTGGAGFAFMAPVFAALASPFVALSAATGISLSTSAIAGFLFVIAPLAIFNNLKRFSGWVDSFKYEAKYRKSHDGSVVCDDVDYPKRNDPASNRQAIESLHSGRSYFSLLAHGVRMTVLNRCSSPFEDEMEEHKKLAITNFDGQNPFSKLGNFTTQN